MSPHSKTPIKGKEHAFQGSFTAWKEVKVFFLIKSLIYSKHRSPWGCSRPCLFFRLHLLGAAPPSSRPLGGSFVWKVDPGLLVL